jgi:hypothetical protein
MPRNPPPGYTRIAPYLLYEDTSAALEWLTKAFGFPGPGSAGASSLAWAR